MESRGTRDAPTEVPSDPIRKPTTSRSSPPALAALSAAVTFFFAAAVRTIGRSDVSATFTLVYL